MSVKFIIDSASDVLPEEAQALGVTHIPMQVSFGEQTYADAVTISHGEFYEKLEQSQALPTTSQINPDTFAKVCKELTENGESVVIITLSSKLSGTYQSAVIAAQEYPGKVFVVDSLSAAVGQRILLMRGLEMAQQGMPAEQIAQALDAEKTKIRVAAIIDTLEYLKKGGRISATVAFAGGLLAIKPAIEIVDGEVAMAGTARGVKKCHALLRELIEKHGGIDRLKPMAFVYSGSSDELLQSFISNTADLWEGCAELPVHSLGSAIGTHIGPGAYGIAFFEK